MAVQLALFDWTTASPRAKVDATFGDAVRAASIAKIAEQSWQSGWPDAFAKMGDRVDEDFQTRVALRLNLQGERHGHRREHYVIDYYEGVVYLNAGIEGPAVYRIVNDFWGDVSPDDRPPAPTFYDGWAEFSINEVEDAKRRHDRLEKLLDRAWEVGMYQIHELYRGWRHGHGPPPPEGALNRLEKRIEKQAEETTGPAQ